MNTMLKTPQRNWENTLHCNPVTVNPRYSALLHFSSVCWHYVLFGGHPNNHTRGAQIQVLPGTCWKNRWFFFSFTSFPSFLWVCLILVMQNTYIKFVTQTPKIIQEIWNKVFTHEPPPNTIFNCFPCFFLFYTLRKSI